VVWENQCQEETHKGARYYWEIYGHNFFDSNKFLIVEGEGVVGSLRLVEILLYGWKMIILSMESTFQSRPLLLFF